MGEATFEYQLGEHEGRVYFLVARHVPTSTIPRSSVSPSGTTIL